MKIESVDFFYYKMPVVTDEGDGSQDALLVRVRSGSYEGWGECEAAPLPTIAAWCCPRSHGVCRPVQESVLGQKLNSPEDIYRINSAVRENSLDLLQAAHTLSGIDIALWDLLARSKEIPICDLLGVKKIYPKLPYASVLFGDTPEETLAKADNIRKVGFRAVKFGWNLFGRSPVETDIQHVEAARAGIGEDNYVMIDAGTVWKDDVEEALKRTKGICSADITWLEEPFVSGALEAYRNLRKASPHIALAAGEGAHNFHMAKAFIDSGCIEFVQIDTGRVGGITTSRQVAAYAAQHNCKYVNHTFTSMLALSASLTPYWDLEDSFFCEYPLEPKLLCREATRDRIEPGDDGMIRPLDRVGLGVSPDMEALKKYLVDLEITVNGETLYKTPKE